MRWLQIAIFLVAVLLGLGKIVIDNQEGQCASTKGSESITDRKSTR